MTDVTITLPDIPDEVDAAEMLRACVTQIADGRPLADLRSQYVREILGQIADGLRVNDEPRAYVPVDLAEGEIAILAGTEDAPELEVKSCLPCFLGEHVPSRAHRASLGGGDAR